MTTAIRIYLSGAMTGKPDLNFHLFNDEAARLRAMGYEVVNPAEINPDHSKSWNDCMRSDLIELLSCDKLALLPGWENSKGVHLEMDVAHRVGMPICMAADLLIEAGMTIENTNTLSVLRRLERAA